MNVDCFVNVFSPMETAAHPRSLFKRRSFGKIFVTLTSPASLRTGVVKTFRCPLLDMVDFRSASPTDRFVVPAARDRLNAQLGFTPDPRMQDWEIELSDGARLREFVDSYTTLDLNDDERFALMALIVASADDALDFDHPIDDLWPKIHELLIRDRDLHESTIHYWCCPDATSLEGQFLITPRIRSVWDAAFNSKP